MFKMKVWYKYYFKSLYYSDKSNFYYFFLNKSTDDGSINMIKVTSNTDKQ